ncbi:MAG TPA: glycogen debranching N-terminal domain-containing protein, partial [Thermoanaerobaculia bacterium]
MPSNSIDRSLVRIRARPNTFYVAENRSVMATDRRGFILGEPDHGFFVHQTRLLSRYCYLIDGEPPTPNVLSSVTDNSWLGYYLAAAPGMGSNDSDRGSGHVPSLSTNPLEIRVERFVSDGLHEEITATNFSTGPTSFTLTIEIDADFADAGETESGQPMGTLTRRNDDGRMVFDFRAEHRYENQSESGVARLHRGLVVEIRHPSSPPLFRDGALDVAIELQPAAEWHACLDFTPRIEDVPLPPRHSCRRSEARSTDDRVRKTHLFFTESTHIEAPGMQTLTPVVVDTLEQARHDLASLRLFDLDRGDHSWTVAAGLPLYIALFGRDTLTTGYQAGLLAPDLMTGALTELAARQGREINDWRDEQPGKMLHEAHTGPQSILNRTPRARSYSSITTSGLYPFILAELWHWTGDKTLIRPLVEPALRALQWVDRYGDIDGDGLFEYRSRSALGPRNQAWKDSSDAIVYEDGGIVEPPIATCEEQAFVYIGKLHLSEVMWWLGEPEVAKKLYREASELKKRFNEAFWMPDRGFYAMALDAEKRQVTTIGSNAGHCVAAAIAESSLVSRVVDRLFEPDLFSGWGIRTLSSAHPRYNPYSYHLGSIWPVEQGTFALGFMRYRLHHRVQQIARAQFEAAALFESHRLPELFGGHPRDAGHPFPGIYPNANSPQAWSASSVFCLLQAMLGLYPYAPLNLLLVDPHLPEWLPEIT